MKSEPSMYSIEDLRKEKKALWDGVRNYQARNFMMQDMKIGDEILFYHSLSKPPGIAGLALVSSKANPDPTAFDLQSKYYDSKSSKKKPRWFCVEVQFKKVFKKLVSIEYLRKEKELQNMWVLRKGQRLSIMPVTQNEFAHIVKISQSC